MICQLNFISQDLSGTGVCQKVPATRFAAFPIGIACLAAAYCAAFAYFVESAPIRVPVYDLLDWLRFYGERLEAQDWLGYLWAPHNEHRIAISRILLLLDVRFLHGQGTAFLVFNALLLSAIAVAASVLVLSVTGATAFGAVALSFTLMLALPTYIATAVSMPAMGVFLHTSAFALFSLLLIDAEPSNFRRFAAFLTGCIASFGVSGGLLIWPVMAWLSWRRSQGRFWIAIIGFGVCFGILYLHGAPAPHTAAIGVAQALDILDYVIRFLGLPWSHMHALVWPSRAVGLTLLLLGSFLIARDTLTKPTILRTQRIGLALLLFTLIVASAAGAARSDIATDREMPIRYAAFVGLAHLGLLLYWLPNLQRLWNGAAKPWLEAMALGIAGALLAQQLAVGLSLTREAARYNEAWAQFAGGEWTPEMTHYVYPDADRAREILAYLRAHSVPWTQLGADK
jgi:hypothetical protein